MPPTVILNPSVAIRILPPKKSFVVSDLWKSARSCGVWFPVSKGEWVGG